MTSSKYYGFTIDGQHINDFGLMCVDKSIGFPEKEKLVAKPAFSNHIIDFSNINGTQQFTERNLMYKFIYNKTGDGTRDELYLVWTKVVNWLMGYQTKTKLYDDAMQEYYYLAEVVTNPSFEEFYYNGTLTIEFTAYPFRIKDSAEGDDIWDGFNFELDIAQETQYTVSGTQKFVLYNTGTSIVSPTIKASTAMTIIQNNRSYQLMAGTNEISRIHLKSGENKLEVEGTGIIEFIFHKELI